MPFLICISNNEKNKLELYNHFIACQAGKYNNFMAATNKSLNFRLILLVLVLFIQRKASHPLSEETETTECLAFLLEK